MSFLTEDEDTSALVAALDRANTASNSNSLYYKLQKGTTNIRFLNVFKKIFPDDLVIQTFYKHYVDGKTYFCLNQTLKDKNGEMHSKENCPICTIASQLWKKGTPDSQERAKKLFRRDKYVARILVRGRKEGEKKVEHIPVFFEFGKQIYDTLYNALKNPSKYHANVVSVVKGLDFEITREGDGLYTKYKTDVSRDAPGAAFKLVPEVEPQLEQKAAYNKKIIKEAEDKIKTMGYNTLVEFITPSQMRKEVLAALNGESEKEGEELDNKLQNSSEALPTAVDFDSAAAFTDDDIFGSQPAVKPTAPASEDDFSAEGGVPDDIQALMGETNSTEDDELVF